MTEPTPFEDDYPDGAEQVKPAWMKDPIPVKATESAPEMYARMEKAKADRLAREGQQAPAGAGGLFTAKWEGAPKPKQNPTYAEAVALVHAVRKIRDDINRQLVKYYNWAEVKDLGLAKQLDLLQSIALEGSSMTIGKDTTNAKSQGQETAGSTRAGTVPDIPVF